MSERHATVLVNRGAGSGRRLGEVATLVKELTNRGWRVSILIPATRQDVVPSIDRAVRAGTHCLIIAGGDGTWHEAIQAQHILCPTTDDTAVDTPGHAIPLALLPIGTGDDNARSFHLPIADPKATAHLVDIQATRTIDLGLVHTADSSRWFSGVLSVGFDSQVNARANGYRRLPGTFRYLVAAARELAHFSPSDYLVTTSSGSQRFTSMLIAIGNGGYYGGGMAICPDFSHTDGQLDVTIIGALPRSRFVATLPSVYSGGHIRHQAVTVLRSDVIEIEAEGQLVFADGEPVGTVPIRVECVPHALAIIAP